MTIDKLSALERLNEMKLSTAEEEKMIALFSSMYSSEQKLSDVNTDGKDVMVFVRPMINVLREDVRRQDFSRESLLAAGPEHTEDSWQVPRLVK